MELSLFFTIMVVTIYLRVEYCRGVAIEVSLFMPGPSFSNIGSYLLPLFIDWGFS